jgi:hypothetical protein
MKRHRAKIVQGASPLAVGRLQVQYQPTARGVLKKPSESAGRNPFLPEHQASHGRQEGIPDDARIRRRLRWVDCKSNTNPQQAAASYTHVCCGSYLV